MPEREDERKNSLFRPWAIVHGDSSPQKIEGEAGQNPVERVLSRRTSNVTTASCETRTSIKAADALSGNAQKIDCCAAWAYSVGKKRAYFMGEAGKSIKLFEERHVRAEWDAENEKWWFSVLDVIAILTDQSDYGKTRNYWKWLKNKLKAEGSELVSTTNQLKLTAQDGKRYLTDVADTEQILRLIQSIPSKKAEPFKLWLAKVGRERLDEMVDPELSINRAIQNYRRLGYSESWINQRIKTIEVRKALTDEWDKSGVRQGQEYAALTDLMSKTWSGMSTREYKRLKGLKKENLRDNMTNTELVLGMLAEVAATDISLVRHPVSFKESAEIAETGAQTAKIAREHLEKNTGKSAISRLNAQNLRQNMLEEGNE